MAACLVVAACSGDPDPAPTVEPPQDVASSTPTPPPATPSRSAATDDPRPINLDAAGDLQRVLDRRARALLERDRAGYLATLARDPAVRAPQERYFDNLQQLPLATVGYRLVPSSLIRSGAGYWAVVEVTLQLERYDRVPARTIDRIRFVPARGRTDFRIASTTDPTWEARNLGVQQPWDIEAVRVREGAGALGVFDTATAAQAATLVRATERGIADVAARVPYEDWSRTAVFYALADPAFLESFDDLPGGDPEALDGIAFSVPAAADETAATRFVLHPEALSRRGAALDRLVRHELVHVAVGTHDDRAPVWLSEGLAEWVSVQALAPEDRRVPASALAAARAGIDEMPSDEAFNDGDTEVHYALAWWVCEWLAATYGADAPWLVLDAFTSFEDGPGTTEGEVVREVLDMSVDQLARRGARLMVTTYAPPPPTPPTTPPTGPAATPPAEPTESPTS